MVEIKIWNKEEGFNLADGTPCTVEEIFQQYPFTRNGVTVLEYLPNGNVGAIDDLAILRQVYEIDEALGDSEAVAEIKRIRELPPEPYADPVEAKLDYLVMMNS